MMHEPTQTPDARIWSPKECAARLNKSVPWLYAHLPRLQQLGFPRKDRELGGWDSKTIEVWLDQRFMGGATGAREYEMLEAARGKH
jgi:hypothetical protein